MDILMADANLRRRAATCVLPGVSVGGLTYFRRSDLDEWRLQLVATRGRTGDVDTDQRRARD